VIFWAHGTADYVPIDCKFSSRPALCYIAYLLDHIVATQSVDYLVNPVGFKKISKSDKPTAGTVTFSTHEGMKHETNLEELEDIQKW
jgi:hypothetical protein